MRIDSVVLGEVLMGALRAIRFKAAGLAREGELGVGLREFCEGFILKDLLGDGTVGLRPARGRRKSPGMNITINEVNGASQAEIISILNGLGLRTTPCSKDKTNRIGLRRNLHVYLWLLKNGSFVGHIRNRGKFLASFYNNHQTKSLLRLLEFKGKVITARQFAKITGISLDAAYLYLLRHAKKGHLRLLESKGQNDSKYMLTQEGQQLVETLERGLEELQTNCFEG